MLPMQGAEEGKELLIRQLPERQLDLGEVYVLDYETDTHATPKISGTIVKGAVSYQVIPVETFVSGNAFEGVEEKYLVCVHTIMHNYWCMHISVHQSMNL